MKGRRPFASQLRDADRHSLQEIVEDGHVMQRVAGRAQALLALDRGERLCEIVHWLGFSRTGVWHLWQRYQHRGVDALFDGQRSGRPASFPPSGARHD